MTILYRTVIQSAILKSAANLAAQLGVQYQSHDPQPLDWERVAEFAIFGLIQAQLNCLWQQFLEETFPTRAPSNPTKDKKYTPCINWLNVGCKLLLDQTLGLFIMNSVFLGCTNAMRLKDPVAVIQVVRENIFRIIKAAWKIWPWVSICNFLWVPVEKRVLVASIVGFGWNIFLTLFAVAK